MSWVVLLVGSYLLGSVPFAYLMARARKGVDLRRVGSGNPGATNVLRVAGPVAALVALALDAGKGYLPTLAGRALDVPPWLLGWRTTTTGSGALARFRSPAPASCGRPWRPISSCRTATAI